jgi:hypothetical protein
MHRHLKKKFRECRVPPVGSGREHRAPPVGGGCSRPAVLHFSANTQASIMKVTHVKNSKEINLHF